MKVLTLTYKGTHCYLVEINSGWILIDAGWPDTLPQFLQLIKRENIKITDKKYLIVTHFHPDHAGLTEELKDLGIKLILFENQIDYIHKLNKMIRKNPKINYKDIKVEDNIKISSKESREFLEGIGIKGEIIYTPGHSDDSVSFVIDNCCVFTGDLPRLSALEAYNDSILNESWNLILKYNVKKVYPSHGEIYNL